jgi:hypothetical protein
MIWCLAKATDHLNKICKSKIFFYVLNLVRSKKMCGLLEPYFACPEMILTVKFNCWTFLSMYVSHINQLSSSSTALQIPASE